MKIIKRQSFLILSPVLLVFVFSHLAAAQKMQYKGPTATLKGTIHVKEIFGFNQSKKMTCEQLIVSAPFSRGYFDPTAKAKGDISTGKCSYEISNVAADKEFIPKIKASFPDGCEIRIFDVYEPNLKLKVKANQTFTFNFSVKKIKCQQLK